MLAKKNYYYYIRKVTKESVSAFQAPVVNLRPCGQIDIIMLGVGRAHVAAMLLPGLATAALTLAVLVLAALMMLRTGKSRGKREGVAAFFEPATAKTAREKVAEAMSSDDRVGASVKKIRVREAAGRWCKLLCALATVASPACLES